VDAHCLDQYFKCFSGDTYATCLDLNSCLNTCPDDNPATPNTDEAQLCVNDCFSGASYAANMDWDHMLKCAYGKCVTECDKTQADYDKNVCNKCVNGALFDAECMPYTKNCFPNGDETCGQILNCINGCAQGDSACPRECFSKGTFEDQDQFGEWQQCALDACKTECDDTAADYDVNTCNTC